MRRIATSICTLVVLILVLGYVRALPMARETDKDSVKLGAILTGREAREWVAELRRTRPRFAAAEVRSAARLVSYGYKPTDQVVVYFVDRNRPVRAASAWERLREFFAPSLFAQTQESSEGYAIFTSWDDGNGATWEGNMYFVDSVEPIDMSIDGQLDISQDQPPPVLWASGEMTGKDGGPLPIDFESYGGLRPFLGVALDHGAGNAGGFMNAGIGASQSPCACGTPQLAKCLIKKGWDDSWPYCAGAAFGCLFTGPAWFACTSGGCGAAFVANVIIAGRAYSRECLGAPQPDLTGVSTHADTDSPNLALCSGLRVRSLDSADGF